MVIFASFFDIHYKENLAILVQRKGHQFLVNICKLNLGCMAIKRKKERFFNNFFLFFVCF